MSRRSVLTLVAIVVLGGLAAWVRWQGVHRELWLDELATSWVVRDSAQEVLERSWMNNLSPAYFLLVKCSTEVFGHSELALRLPSLIAGVLLIPAVWHLVHLLGGSPFACALASGLAIFHPALIAFSIDARPYALVQLVGTLQLCAFARLESGGTRNAVAFCLLSAAMAYLHYTTVLILGAELAAMLVTWAAVGAWNRRQLQLFVVGCVAVALLCLPMASHLHYLAERRKVLGLVGRSLSLKDGLLRFQAMRYLYIPLFAGLLIENLFSSCPWRRPVEQSRQTLKTFGAVLVLAAFLVPLLAVWASTRLGLARLDTDRYVALSSVALVAAPAILYARLAVCPARYTLLALVLVMTQLTGANRIAYACLRGEASRVVRGLKLYEGWEDAARVIRERLPAGCPIFFLPQLVERAFLGTSPSPVLRSYLLCPFNSVYRFTDDQLSRCRFIDKFEDLEHVAPMSPAPRGFAVVFSSDDRNGAETAARKLQARLGIGGSVEMWTNPELRVTVLWAGPPTKP